MEIRLEYVVRLQAEIEKEKKSEKEGTDIGANTIAEVSSGVQTLNWKEARQIVSGSAGMTDSVHGVRSEHPRQTSGHLKMKFMCRYPLLNLQ